MVTPGKNLLGHLHGDAFEMDAGFQINAQAGQFGFRLRVGNGEQTTVGYDAVEQKIFVDRLHSGQTGFEKGFARIHAARMAPVDGAVHLQIFLDRSCIEVFGNEGEVTIADTIFPDAQSQEIELFAQGGEVLLRQLDVYEMTPANITAVEA
jgi:fructan beta-fructosidase